jgi:hypothetical protein
MWLGWQPAALMAVACGAGAFLARRARGRAATATAVARELGLVLALYAFWRFVMRLRSTRLDEGIAHGYDVWDIEKLLGIANEDTLEHWVLQHDWLMRAANVFYATVHVPALVAFLVWLFFRHRESYPPVRNLLAATTGVCLVLHWIPVAPPRMYPDLGFVDAARQLGQSVYGPVGQGISNQVSALPSLHAAWALIVAYGVIVASRSRWRWWILAHPVLTILVIVVTANHWWLDSIAAAGVIAVVLALQWALAVARSRFSVPGAVADVVAVPSADGLDPEPVGASF